MGAEQFVTIAKGENANEAFSNAVKEAQYDYGHSGYSGSIAEKGEFRLFKLPTLPEGAKIEDVCWKIMDMDGDCVLDPGGKIYEAVDDKWGPAGCFHMGDDFYIFFGWASS